jgi:hypothetical protein
VVQASKKEGSALIMVLAVIVVVAVLITSFGADMKQGATTKRRLIFSWHVPHLPLRAWS